MYVYIYIYLPSAEAVSNALIPKLCALTSSDLLFARSYVIIC